MTDKADNDALVRDELAAMRKREVQLIGAGISMRDWHATEIGYNQLRDRVDGFILCLAALRTPQPEVVDRSLFPGLDHVANFINALDSERMSVSEVRSAIYAECITPQPGETETLRAEILKVKAGYESQMKFCDVEALGYFREFVRRLDAALKGTDHGRG